VRLARFAEQFRKSMKVEGSNVRSERHLGPFVLEFASRGDGSRSDDRRVRLIAPQV
jgi:hypothetical protein